MKKILIILLAILCIPISSYAISLSTLENNPDRFKKIGETYEVSAYIDIASIKSIRYSPPYYTLGIKTYYVIYSNDMIFAYSEVYNYDYSYSLESTMKRVISNMQETGEPLDNDTIYSRTLSALQNNSGIKSNSTFTSAWNLEGKPFKSPKYFHPKLDNTVKYGTHDYEIAELLFKTYYNQSF